MNDSRLRCPWLLVCALALVACGGEGGADAARGHWQCPAEWVPYERGGCGPAVLLCVPDGGAAAGACDGVDLTHPHAIPDGDGGTTTSFYRLPDGAIGGPWHEPGEPGGPPTEAWAPDAEGAVPAVDWAPDAGISSCPAGWLRSIDGACDAQLRADCPAGSEAVPGAQCTATAATTCPAGAYADPGVEALGATVVRVRANADPAGADGSEARPFPSLAAALASAPPPTWVLLASGTYREALAVATAVHVVGRCASEVRLAAPAGATTVVRAIAGAALDLRGLTVSGAGLEAAAGAHLRLRGVRIEAVVGYGLNASGAGTQVDAADGVITGTRASAGSTASGVGLIATSGAVIVAERLVVTDNTSAGVAAGGAGTSITLTDVVASSTLARPDETFGSGLYVEGGATVAASRVALLENASTGVYASGAGTQVALTDALVLGTHAPPAAAEGRGLIARSGAHLVVTRVRVEHSVGTGGSSSGAGTQLVLVDSVVRATQPRSDHTGGRGVVAQSGASLTATRTLIHDNAEIGAFATDAMTRLSLTDSTVRATRPNGLRQFGRGIVAQNHATLIATRSLVAENTDYGALATGAGVRIELTDSAVRATRPNEDGTFGIGISVEGGATLNAARTRLSENTNVGARARGQDSRLEMTGAVIESTRERANFTGGFGLSVEASATVVAAQLLVSRNTGSGVIASDPGSRLEITDAVVLATRPRGNGAGGRGLETSDGATLIATRVLGDGNAEIGAFGYGAAARLELVDSVVRGTRAGADDRAGFGLLVRDGATIAARRTVIADSVTTGGAVGGSGARLEFVDSVVRSTRGQRGSILGRGLEASDGSTLLASRVLVEDSREAGVGVFEPGTTALASDVIVNGTTQTLRGEGGGVAVVGGARGTFTRLAVIDVAGAGVAASIHPTSGLTDGAAVLASDVFVRSVARSTVTVRSISSTNREVAYGLHAGAGCTLTATRAVVDDGEFGAFNAGGRVSVLQGVIARQSVAAAGRSSLGSAADLVLLDVIYAANASDAVLLDDSYPTAAFETPDTCYMPPCR